MRAFVSVLLAAVVSSSAACVSRPRCSRRPAAGEPAPPAHVARARALLEEAREREPNLPMLDEAATRAALKSMRSEAAWPTVPNLMRIAAVLPKTADAEMAAWAALGKEGTIDKRLLAEVFYVVSSANECGH